MTHYSECIRRYESAQDFDNYYEEATYKILLKNSFSRINKNEEFEKQLLRNNIIHHNMMTMQEIITMLLIHFIIVFDH